MSSPIAPVNTLSRATPRTPRDASKKALSLPSSARTTSSSIDSTPYTPLSLRSRNLSSAFTTPVHDDLTLDGLSPLTRSKVSRLSFADTSSNWRTKGESPTQKLAALRSPAFMSNDRRLPRAFSRTVATDSLSFSSDTSSSLFNTTFKTNPVSELREDSDYRSYPGPKPNVPAPRLPAIPDEDQDSTRRASDFFIRMDTTGKHDPTALLFSDDVANVACAACGSRLTGLSYLKPCRHPICHQCFTGILNIVGEKGLQCPSCRSSITDFACPPVLSRPLLAVVESTKPEAPSATVSRPPLSRMTSAASTSIADTEVELPVLRIDNLPWDVTPSMLTSWLPLPAEQIHVLLERSTGKTLSHCYVELSPQNARVVLRTCQNKIIGQGRRIRAVSVTRSSQEELMREVFPTWKGSFRASQPSVEGMGAREAEEVIRMGLLSYKELESLMNLINTPESHFLKVPTLPFHVLVSILQKFPVECDARMLWTSELRDRLYAVTQAAVHVLHIRVNQQDWDSKLLDDLAYAAIDCLAFTDLQRRVIAVTARGNLNTAYAISESDNEAPASPASLELNTPTEYVDDLSPGYFPPGRRYSQDTKGKAVAPEVVVAKEPTVSDSRGVFEEIGQDVGVDADLVRMVFQRLFVGQ